MSGMAEPLRLLEAVLFASAEPVEERLLADRLPPGADLAIANCGRSPSPSVVIRKFPPGSPPVNDQGICAGARSCAASGSRCPC